MKKSHHGHPPRPILDTTSQIGVIKPGYAFCPDTPNPSLEEYSPMKEEIQTSPISSTPTTQRAPTPPISNQDGNHEDNVKILLKKTLKNEHNINQKIIINDVTDSNSYVKPRENPPLCSNFIVSTPPPKLNSLPSTIQTMGALNCHMAFIFKFLSLLTNHYQCGAKHLIVVPPPGSRPLSIYWGY